MKRRSLLKTAAVGVALSIGALAGTMAAAQELTKIDLRLGFIHNVQNGDLYLAIDRGIFEKNGLEINIIPGGPGAPNSLAELAADNVQIAMGAWNPFVGALDKGNDFVMIATLFQSSPLGVISLTSDPIHTAQDMVGAKILAQGRAAETAVGVTMSLNELDPASVEFVPTGFSPEPLLAGDGKGYTAFATNQRVALDVMGLVQGKDYEFHTLDELGNSSIASTLTVKREYLENNRDVLVKFMASLIEANAINVADLSAAAKLAVEVFGVDFGLNMAQELKQNEVLVDFVRPGGDPDFQIFSLDEAKITGPIMQATEALGRFTLPDNIMDYIDTSIVADAHAMVAN